MSLFKRKQSKDKDATTAPVAVTEGGTQLSTPPMSGAPNGPNGTPGQGGQVRMPSGPQMPGPPVTAQQGQQRRMTSNPMAVMVNGFPIPPTDMSGPPQPSQAMIPQSQPRQATPASSTQYPWSYRPIRLAPSTTSPPSAPTNPFPRYGLAVPAFPSHSGHMLIFGGLVHDHVRNDLWSMEVKDCSTACVRTSGQLPAPRVGHASAMADRIMLMWGGDTKVKPEDKQDEGLYILDLRSQEWTRMPVTPGPAGRYGHAACLLGSKFYIFGGQAEGAFMNDLWSYDIRQAFSGDGNQHVWEKANYKTPPPSPRTGHILLSWQNMLYVFGGTDGNFHYNDTWRFDPETGEWTELSCIGYIPVPREGHAAAIVDDVIYVFGGRDVNGKDLGDLAAFRISNSRWYMFQNMGPAPSARSGHAMVAAHGTIFVLGGEANASNGVSKDDPSLIHMLDTVKIKYPADKEPPRLGNTMNERVVYDSGSPKRQPPNGISQPNGGLPPSASIDSLALARTTSPLGHPDRTGSLSAATNIQPLAPPIETRSISRSDSQPADMQTNQSPIPAAIPQVAPRSGTNGGPPQRPKRDGDDDFRRALSPVLNGPSSPVQAISQNQSRIVSPPNGPASPPQTTRNGFNPSLLGTRSPSPRLRQQESYDKDGRPAPPPDAFFYGRSPTSNNFNPNGMANGHAGRPISTAGSGSSDLVRELKANQAEIEASRKREGAMRVLLGRAVNQGFVMDDEDVDLSAGGKDSPGVDGDMVKKLMSAVVKMKQEKAVIQNEFVAQIRIASEKASDAERLRRGALQEAAFYRAKIATLESSSPSDLSRIEKERISDLERQLASLSTECTTAQRELTRIRETSAADQHQRSMLTERETESARRAEEVEEAHRGVLDELENLRQQHGSVEATLRDHAERMVVVSSAAQQHKAERDHVRSQLEEASTTRDVHLGLIQSAQSAIAAAGTRTTEMETLYNKATARISDLEAELTDARSEIENRTRDAELSAERLAEVEIAYTRSREEAESLRQVTTSRLGELLESHKEIKAGETRGLKGHQEQMRALEEESKSLRKMLREAGQRLEDAEAGVSHHRSKAKDLEVAHHSLKGEIRSFKTKHMQSQQELAKFRDLHGAKDAELRERDLAVTEIETRCTVLRNLLADHGIAISDHDLDQGETSSTRELEAQLRERDRAHENAQREIETLNQRCLTAEDQVESLGRMIERMNKDTRSPTGMSMRSPSPSSGDPRHDQDRKIAEIENQHKEKLAALESDYQTAVRYVKGTEKMLKRMKEELSKQKTSNTALQAEIDNLRGRPSEAGSRTRDVSGRSTPSADPDLQRRLASLQSAHSAVQAELSASRDVLAAREREVDLMRMRVEEAEREVEILREDLAQAQQRISTLLEMGGSNGFDLGSEDGEGGEGGSEEDNSEEATMAFDKFTNELKQWERTRSPTHQGESEDDNTAQYGKSGNGKGSSSHKASAGTTNQDVNKGHRRNSSEYSGNWVQ